MPEVRMKKEIYKAAVRGDVEFLKEAMAKDVEAAVAVYSYDDLLGVTSQGNNIVHVAAQFGHLNFIKAALERFPAYADHLASKQQTRVLAEHHLTGSSPSPWMIQNKKGNTPLHVALMSGGQSIHLAAYLLEVDPEMAAVTNHLKQTPLHLAVMYDTQGTEMSFIKMTNTLNSQEPALTSRNGLFVQEYEDISISLVSSLLEKNSEVCCLCDADGMTPLLRAAVSSNLPVVDAIIHYCPESIEVCDPKGKNMLHFIRFPTFLEARIFLEKPEISALLINQQDHDGNTPMHIAVMTQDFVMVKAMVQHNAHFAIKNKEGASAQALFEQFAINNKLDVSDETQIHSKSNKFRHLVEENEKMIIKDELMSNELYIAVGNAEWGTLRERLREPSYEKHFLSRLPDGSNIVHLAIQGFKQSSDEPCSEQFIVDVLNKFPALICQTNRLGETPIHLEMFHKMVRFRLGMLFSNIKEHFMIIKEQGELIPKLLPLPPWKAKDVQGNTILHRAINYDNFEFAEYLIQLDANLTEEVNHSKETPLHLLCQQKSDWKINKPLLEKRKKLAKLLLEKNLSSAVYSRDDDGFTPLLRAVQRFWTQGIAIEILKQHPQSIRQNDSHGRNFFHYLPDINEERKRELCETIPYKEMGALITQKDDEGNSPFDLAVERRCFLKAQFLIECSGDFHGAEFHKWLHRNKESTVDMIFDGQIPTSFQDFLSSRDVVLELLPVYNRSTYGVRRDDIKEYMNPMGVVAALLATVTFTAAFTVPGGYNTSGIPNLGTKAAFQVFMVADVVGMCSSMMVLFCLLWLLSKDDDEDDEMQMVFVDMTINLLRVSFYATLLAFMTGIYVTTFSISPWLAIFTCVFSSLVILLMRRGHIKTISILVRALPYFIFHLLPYYYNQSCYRSQRLRRVT